MSSPAPSPLVVVASQSGARANGGLESLVRIVEGLPREVVALTDRDGDVAARLRAAGRTVHVWELRPIDPRHPLEPIAGRALRAPALGWFNERTFRLLRRSGARLLLANDIRAFWHAAPAARAAGARVAFTNRDMFLPGRPYGAKWRLTRHLSAAVVTLSESMRRETLERIPPYFGSGAPVEAIYSIVEGRADAPASPEERAQLRARLGLPARGAVFLVVGSFCDKKNQLELIERGLPPLFAAVPDATVAFVGDFDPERDAYARRCGEAARGLGERVRFAGFTRDVRSYLRAADATCVASRYEGLARAMIESAAQGTPVVSFDVTSAREILEGEGAGVVVPQGDHAALAAALAALARAPDRGSALGAAGLAAARRLFSRERAIAAYEELFRRLEAAPGAA